MHRLTVVAALVAVLGACSGNDRAPFVLVALDGVPRETDRIEVRFRLDGVDAAEPEEFTAPPEGFSSRTTFVALLPDGADGLFEVDARAFDDAGCPLALGAAGVMLPHDRLDVPLGAIDTVCGAIAAARYPWNGFSTPTLTPRFVWEPVAGATRYELQLDDSCFTPDCAFPSPEVDTSIRDATEHRLAAPLAGSSAPPVGRRYVWRVRACDDVGLCSAWSSARYLDVGRQPSDLDGDGLADFAVGAFRQDTPPVVDTGVVFVFGGASTPPLPITMKLVDPDTPPSSEFGFNLSSGDLDGDGFSDLVVGALGGGDPMIRPGAVFVYDGSASGLNEDATIAIPNPSPQPSAGFGVRVATGDVDGDGYADIVVAAVFHDEPDRADAGRVYWFRGGAGGVDPFPAAELRYPRSRGGAPAFGIALSLATDFDGDGWVDLAVGAPAARDQTLRPNGAVFVYRGGPGGFADTPDGVIPGRGTTEANGFGNAIAAGDVDGDGFGDLVIGAFADGPATSGRAFVMRGGPGGLDPAPWAELVAAESGSTSDTFGYGVIVADLDGDGRGDPIIGAYGYANVGAAFAYRGDPIQLAPDPWARIDSPFAQAGAQFGFALGSPGDVDGDGYADVVVGALGQDVSFFDEGAAYLFYGASTGIDTTTLTFLSHPEPQPSAFFGVAVTSMP